ncbi:MAG: toll/interleukin-1 receptor domain-containing protein [Myxococcales bacterium]|nr:toll/interleukin-1 receptor domain-containing protein [Myxococcales bacterium]
MKRWDFFLIHAGLDKPRAEQLYDALLAVDPHCKVFLDSRSLQFGDRWDQVLPRALRESAIAVVLVSGRIDNAYYAGEEIAIAIAASRDPANNQRVIPVYLDGLPTDLRNIPYGLKVLHSIDTRTAGWPQGVAQQLVHTKGGLPPGVIAAPPPLHFDLTTVFGKLSKMLPAQLDAVVVYAGFDRAYLTPGAPPATRASELIHLASQSTEHQQRLTDAIGKI